MKTVLLTIVEPTRATLLIALAIGLGIEIHPLFFLVALVIAIGAFAESIINAAFAYHP